jgi:hypothetical protein
MSRLSCRISARQESQISFSIRLRYPYRCRTGDRSCAAEYPAKSTAMTQMTSPSVPVLNPPGSDPKKYYFVAVK